ncbi:MAG: CHAT domain-containing protein, partial [Acidiferrobacterales bacterium]
MTQRQHRLALMLVVLGAVLSVGAKWTERPIGDITAVTGTWKGTYVRGEDSFSVTLTIKANGAYEVEERTGRRTGTLALKDGAIQYRGIDQRSFTLTLHQRKKKRTLKGSDERGEFTVSLKPTKQKRAKKNRPKKRKVSLEEAKEITATFDGAAFTRPPRTVNDITAILAQEIPEDLAAYQAALARADRNPPNTELARTLAFFYFDRGQAAHEAGRARQEREDYQLAVEYGQQSDFDYLNLAIWRLGIAERLAGNLSRGIELAEQAISKEQRAVPLVFRNAVISRYYAEAGNLKAAKRAYRRAKQNESKTIRWTGLSDKKRAMMAGYISESRASILDAMGRLTEGERYRRRAIMRMEPYKDEFSKWRRLTFNWQVGRLADNLRRQGRLVEAEVIARKAVRAALHSHGRYTSYTAAMIRRLNQIIFDQGRYAEAEALARATLEIYLYSGAAVDSTRMALARMVLADALLAQARWHEALSEYDAIRNVLKSDRQAYERYIAGNPNQAFALIKGGRAGEALTLIRPVFEQKKALIGETHYDTAEVRGVLAIALAVSGDKQGALTEFTKAIPILLQRPRRSDDADTTQSARELRLGWILEAYIRLLGDIRGTVVESKAGIGAAAEAFRIADVARARTVQRALNASSVRAAARNPELADLVRREQDAVSQIGALHGLLSNALSAQQAAAVVKDLRIWLDKLRRARAALMAEIEKRFTQYVQLINPKPASIADVQASLQPGEALIATYVGDNRSYVWAVPHEGDIAFAGIPLGRTELQAKVDKLRQALDPQAATLGDIPTFDVKLAYKLYTALLKPVEAAWKTSKRLLVVVHGPLGQLPLSVLPTTRVNVGKQRPPLFARYRHVPWLARTHTITVLPSVASLITLRSLPPLKTKRRPFAGFGDPYFSQAQQARAETVQLAQLTSGNLTVRGLPLTRRSIPTTRSVSSADLAKLPRLPDTAQEVKAIARALRADLAKDVFIGEQASETQVKTMDLSDRKVIAFATHGLVPGDLDGL